MKIRFYAVTYPQLMNQAREKAFTESEFVRLRAAFESAQKLFDGLYRGQNVPFICHLTRTASILLEEDQPLEVVMAGLVHAAYMDGYFEDRRHGKASPEHRAQLQREVGAEVESLIFDYDRFPWYRGECVREHLESLNGYGDRQKRLIIMRLANELEDYLDLAMAYRGTFPYREKISAYGDKAVELARRLGRTQLAQELEAAFEAQIRKSVPAFLVTGNRGCYQLPHLRWLKRSYWERAGIRGRELILKFISSNHSSKRQQGVKHERPPA